MAKNWTTKQIKERCEIYRDSLKARGVVSDAEIAAYWPGGESNTERSWVYCYGNLLRFLDRLPSEGERTEKEQAATDELVLKALAGEGETLELSERDKGKPQHVTIYPKSYAALDWIACRDARVGWLVEQREKMLTVGIAVAPRAAELVSEEIRYQYQLIALVVTDPSAFLPWGESEPPETLPEWIQAVNPLDLLRIHHAFVRVNQLRLHGLQSLLQSKSTTPEQGRPSWATFFSARAEEHGGSSRELMRNHDLPGLLASTILAADMRQKAVDDAKRAPDEVAA